MTVIATGNYFIDNDNVFVGNGAYGYAIVNGNGPGFNESVLNFSIGTSGATGILNLVGGGTGVDITVENPASSGFSAAVRVGVDGTGTLNITNGARLVSINNGFYDPNLYGPGNGGPVGGYYNVNIGNRGVGTVTVDGDGSFLGAYGLAPRITVGRNGGTGTLTLQNGGDAGTLSLVIGRGGTGTVNINGAGSVFNVNSSYGLYSSFQGTDSSGLAGGATVGRENGTGSLNIENGGAMIIQNQDGTTDNPFMNVGRNTLSTGTVTVDGTGSTLSIIQNGPAFDDYNGGAFLGVGRSGQGTLTVTNGGTVDVQGDDAFIGISHQRGSEVLTGVESTLRIESGGVVNVDSGTYTGGGVSVAHTEFSHGRLVVDGIGSQLNITSAAGVSPDSGAFLMVGRHGDGVMDVTNGAHVTINANDDLFPLLFVGAGDGYGSVNATGVLTVDGAGSSITLYGSDTSQPGSGGFISVGHEANAVGRVVISGGGAVLNTGARSGMAIGGIEDARGSVTVDGAGSILNAGSGLLVGADFVDGVPVADGGGEAFLEVVNGASLIAERIAVGESGEVDLTGSVTGDMIVYGIMAVGDDVVATLDLSGDFILPTLGVLLIDIADFSGGTGDRLNISGSALLDTRSNIFALDIDQTAAITAGDTYVLASAAGGLLAESRTVYDLTRGIEFTMSSNGTDLILTAEETVAASPAPNASADMQSADEPVDIEPLADRSHDHIGRNIAAGDGGYFVPSLGNAGSASIAPNDISGIGGYTINNDTISVGIGTLGDATIDGNGAGFNEVVTVFNVGHAGGTGALTLSGGGAGVNITVEDPLATPFSAAVRVGIDGTGTLDINSGAQVISRNNSYYDPNFYGAGVGQLLGGYYNVNVGRRGEGTVTVDGVGSLLATYGDSSRINIGRENGTGKLYVQGGGDVGTLSLVVGRQNGTGTVYVDGAGSTVTINDAHGQYGLSRGVDSSGAAGGITLGREGGDGTLIIENGGLVSISNTDTVTDAPYMQLGREADSTGTATVTGVGSRLEIVQNGPIGDDWSGNAFLGIGRSGQGAMTVTAGGVVDVIGNNAWIAIASERSGSGPITTAESHLAITSGGVVNVTGGADDGGWLSVGRSEFGRGRLDVDGVGSQLNLTGNVTGGIETGGFLDVGYDGTGKAYVTNGGVVTIDGNDGPFPGFIVGRGQSDGSVAAHGYLLVDGTGSSITVQGANTSTLGGNGFISIGRNANSEGVMVLTNGGVVSNTGSVSAMEIAGNEGTRGSVTVDGAGSTLNAGSLLSIGSDFVGGVNLPDVGGDGFLEVVNGAALTAGAIFVGESGVVDLTGSVTGDLTVHGIMDIGDDVVATLNLTGDFTLGDVGVLSIEIADFAGGTGDKLNITGSASLDTLSNIFVLEIDRSAAITAGQSYVLATATGGLTAQSRTVYDVTRGIEFTLSSNGTQLLLTAEESVAASGVAVSGGAGNDTLTGTAAAEVIDGLAGNDLIDAQAGADEVYAGIGNDSVVAGDGDDRVNGGDGNDVLDGQAGNDTLLGENGADVMQGGAGNDALQGGNGDDSLFGGLGSDVLHGGADDDVLAGGAGGDTLNGGAGNDTADYSGSTAAVTVSLEAPFAGGGDAQGDQLFGIENLVGSNFDDVLFGDAGSNTIDGGAGGDVLSGGGGSDVLYGGAGFDALSGVDGGAGVADTLFGGSQLDIAYYFTAGSSQVVDFADHANLANNSGEHTLDTWVSIEGFYGADDHANTIRGDAQDNLFLGGSQADALYGGDGSDILIGRGGADLIYGGIGNDFISGDAGDDAIHGGAGEDTFYIFATSGIDRIRDYSEADDGFLFYKTGATQWSDLTFTVSGNDVHITRAGSSFTVIVEETTLADLDNSGGNFSFL